MAQETSSYLYNPSVALAGIVAGLYGINFLATLYQTIRKKSWVWLVMLLGIGMEVVGYAARAISAKNVNDKGPYVLQFALVILAPVVMTGVIYVIFSRIIFWVVPPESRTISMLWVPPRFVTFIFVGFDVVSLLLQLGAAVFIAGTDQSTSDAKSKIKAGKDLGVAGVGIQLAGFGIFTISTIRFHFTSRRLDGEFARANMEKYEITKHWSTLLLVVNASCGLILVRSIFRMVEFAEGKNGKTQQEEWYLYVWDCLPIFLVTVLFNIWFPGSFLRHLNFRLQKQYRALPTSTTEYAL